MPWATKTGILHFFCVFCCALMLSIFPNAAFGQTANGAAGPTQILVLKNGEMLHGRVEQNALQLIIHTVQGSRLVIPKTKADFVCDSLDEAFWQKSARTKASDDVAQVELFRWCLKHRLLDHAENQLNILLNCNITAPELASLNRQLALMLSAQQKRLAEELAKSKVAMQSHTETILPLKPLPAWTPPGQKNSSPTDAPNRDMIRQVSYEQPARQSAATRPHPRLSPIGAIPELKNRSRFAGRPTKAVDPFDPTAFNAETLRRQKADVKN